MALVVFMDSRSRSWRVWNVDRSPSGSRPDYLDAPYRDGWLVFESQDGSERRRLTSYPANWATLPATELEQLCARATMAARIGPSEAELPARAATRRPAAG
jgi:hypothetical protein